MKDTKIEWADHTFNPWWGCTKVSPACDNCYAAALDKRTGGNHWGAGVERRRTSPANWAQPLKWNRNHEAFFKEHGRRQRVFCASMADVFDNEVPREWYDDLLVLIAETQHLDWLLLTKRIGNVSKVETHFPTNVWLGATICNQEEADRDIPKLLNTPAAKRFVSMEPLLGPVDLTDVPMPESEHGHHEFSPIITGNALKRAYSSKPKIDWVIVGGESGHGARPIHPDWAKSLRDQCEAADAPFMFKQWGDWHPKFWLDGSDGSDVCIGEDAKTKTEADVCGFPMVRVGKKAAGRLLDSVEYNGVPA